MVHRAARARACDATAQEAARRSRGPRCGRSSSCDDGRLVGVVTRKTLVREVVARGRDSGRDPAAPRSPRSRTHDRRRHAARGRVPRARGARRSSACRWSRAAGSSACSRAACSPPSAYDEHSSRPRPEPGARPAESRRVGAWRGQRLRRGGLAACACVAAVEAPCRRPDPRARRRRRPRGRPRLHGAAKPSPRSATGSVRRTACYGVDIGSVLTIWWYAGVPPGLSTAGEAGRGRSGHPVHTGSPGDAGRGVPPRRRRGQRAERRLLRRPTSGDYAFEVVLSPRRPLARSTHWTPRRPAWDSPAAPSNPDGLGYPYCASRVRRRLASLHGVPGLAAGEGAREAHRLQPWRRSSGPAASEAPSSRSEADLDAVDADAPKHLGDDRVPPRSPARARRRRRGPPALLDGQRRESRERPRPVAAGRRAVELSSALGSPRWRAATSDVPAMPIDGVGRAGDFVRHVLGEHGRSAEERAGRRQRSAPSGACSRAGD